MKYKVTISEIRPPQAEERYEQSKEIYDQTVEDLDILAVIKAVNGIATAVLGQGHLSMPKANLEIKDHQ